MIRKLLIAAVLCVPIIGSTGCKTLTAAATPGVPQFYSQSALILNDFSGVLLQAQTLFANAHTSGLVTTAQFTAGEAAFSKIATDGDSAQKLVAASASQASVTAAITALIGEVGTMPTTFGIKDATTQASFTALCTSMQTILQAAITVTNATTTVAP